MFKMDYVKSLLWPRSISIMQGLGGEKTQNLLGEDLAKLGQKSSRGRWHGKTQLKAIKIAPRLGEANPSTNTAHERRAWQPRKTLAVS